MIERRTKEGNLRMEGWVTNSHQNHLRMAIYEGGDSYSEFCTKGSVVQRQLQELASKPFQIKGQDYNVRVGLFGDMAFLDSVLGGSGCSCNYACLLCDVHRKNFLVSKEGFKRLQLPEPQLKTRMRRCMLAHCLGEEFGLSESYNCPGCGLWIEEHRAGAPVTKADLDSYRENHFGQRHGRPP